MRVPALTPLRSMVKGAIRRGGFELVKIRDASPIPLEPEAQLDVFDLVVRALAHEVPDFFFVQIGANDGMTADPIQGYVKRYHWRGLLVEPQPHIFPLLARNYREEPQLILENAAIAPSDGVATLYVASRSADRLRESGWATFDRAVLEKHVGAGAHVEEIEVAALSLPTLFAKHGVTHIDLLQIDTEGFDYEVIRMLFDSAAPRPTVIHFEHIHLPLADRAECARFLADRGYRMASSSTDTVAVRHDRA